jgi:uncharacterized protein (TIGR03435 family)
MSIERAVTFLIVACPVLVGQQAVSPGWKEFSIGPATANHSQFSRFGIRAEGVPMKRLLSRAFGLPEHRILGPDWLNSQRYALTAQVDDPKDFQPLMQQELAARFHMLSHREPRVVPVFVLKKPEGVAKPSDSSGMKESHLSDGALKIHGSIADLASALADAIQRPVFDETDQDGNFDIALSWNPGNLASLQAAVKQQLGLELVDDKRMVDLLIIDHIEKLQ